MFKLLVLAWRDLRGSGRSLWVFCACLLLGVTLIAASGGLFQQVSNSLLADTRLLFGGDLEVQQRQPVSDEQLTWMREHGEVSLLMEMRTMLRTLDGRSEVVELQSYDEFYPLYGEVELQPAQALSDALAQRDGAWGAAFDRVLVERLNLAVGDQVKLGDLTVELRAVIVRQPDRSLRADWRGTPLLISADALAATGLIQPGSLLEYEYRVKTDQDLDDWRNGITAAFPQANWEIRTFAQRSERMAEILGQIGSALLLIGFSALFIGGLGVFNSVQAYLQGKLTTLATLRALGMREGRLARLYLTQIMMLAGASSLLGTLIGGALALVGASLAAENLPLTTSLKTLWLPLAAALLFGLLTALTFALPALGRALSVTPAALFRSIDSSITKTPRSYWRLTACLALLTTLLVLLALPQPLFGLAFVLVTVLLLLMLEGLVRLLRRAAQRLAEQQLLSGHYQLRLALANLYRPGAPLRPTLLSLGSALTLLVASTLVVAALLRTINNTVPERAPALVFYDIANFQLEDFRALLNDTPTLQRLDLAPLVLGRISRVNDEVLRDSGDSERAEEARDEQKLSYRLNNFDHVIIDRGAWWPEDYQGPPLVAMEDREADQLGLQVGDRLQFEILGKPLSAELVAIYSQRRVEARFWLEAIFSDGVLDPVISRYVGTAYLDHAQAVTTQTQIAESFPNVVAVRTEGVLNEARTLLAKASMGLAVVAGISLLASLLVLISVVASNRARQVYDATVLHTLGVRVATVRRSLQLEYALVALLTSIFAIALGSIIALVLLEWRIKLETDAVVWSLGVLIAIIFSSFSLAMGAGYLLRQLRLSPALLLRSGG